MGWDCKAGGETRALLYALISLGQQWHKQNICISVPFEFSSWLIGACKQRSLNNEEIKRKQMSKTKERQLLFSRLRLGKPH